VLVDPMRESVSVTLGEGDVRVQFSS